MEVATPCDEWEGARSSGGYGSRWIDGIWGSTHRQTWEEHNGPIPDGMQVLHSCDNPPCVNPDHLFLGGRTDNMKDSSAKGRHKNPVAYGEENPRGNAKLMPEHIPVIRELLARGVTQRAVAELAGVGQQTISSVSSGETWAWM